MMMSGSENTELVFTKFQNASHTHCFRPREVFIEKATVENGQKKTYSSFLFNSFLIMDLIMESWFIFRNLR